ncbi:MAG: DUF4290 domain-containing protein [Cytophagales bacterium]|nr:DUF4290 domain-containing protein [Cytophagales bacterium]
MPLEYNTQLAPIKLKEYGRTVQNIAAKIAEETDAEKRLQMSHSLVRLMKQVAPSQKDNQETIQKIWNHLYYISDFKIELENAPYEAPSAELLNVAPQPVAYSKKNIRMRNYGKNVELLIAQAKEKETEEERHQAAIFIARLMKRILISSNANAVVEDSTVIQQLERMSSGILKLDIEQVKDEGLLYVKVSNNNYQPQAGHSKRTGSGSRNHTNNRSNNNRPSNNNGNYKRKRMTNR